MRTKSFAVKCSCVLLMFGLLSLWMVGCNSSNNQPSTPSQDQEQITGAISEINDSELLVEASSESSNYIEGPVRVDVSSLDSSLVESLTVGDTITAYYAGPVGTSNPPFISATQIDIR